MHEQSSYDSSMDDGKTTALEIKRGDSPPELISHVSEMPLDETPTVPEASIGVRGYLRLLRIFFSFFLFGLRVFLNTRDWVGRKRDVTPEQRHWEGAMLRDK